MAAPFRQSDLKNGIRSLRDRYGHLDPRARFVGDPRTGRQVIRPIVGAASGGLNPLGLEPKINLVSPNNGPQGTFALPLLAPMTLHTNFTKLQTGTFNAFRPWGDRAYIRFNHVWSPADQLSIDYWPINVIAHEWVIFKDPRFACSWTVPSGDATPTPSISLSLHPILVPWDDGITWDTQPLTNMAIDPPGDDTANVGQYANAFADLSAGGGFTGSTPTGALANAPFAITQPAGTPQVADDTYAPLNLSTTVFKSTFCLPGATTTSLRVINCPIGYIATEDGDPPVEHEHEGQVIYDSWWNKSDNFIGALIKVYPSEMVQHIGDPSTWRPIGTSSVIGFNGTTGVMTLDPLQPLPYAPHGAFAAFGSPPASSQPLADYIEVYYPIYGFAVQAYDSQVEIEDRVFHVDATFRFSGIDMKRWRPAGA